MTVVVALVVALLMAGGASGYILWRVHQISAQFKPLPGFPRVRCAAPPDVRLEFVSAELNRASVLLAKYGPWTISQVVKATSEVAIIVMQSNSWVDVYGRKVAGEEVIGQLQVGHNLAALCHELAHYCEQQYDEATDDGHMKWGGRGIQKAVDAFEGGEQVTS